MSGQPVPQGNYVGAKRHGSLIFTAGMTPRQDGVLMFSGAARVEDPLDKHEEAVVLAVRNALSAARAQLAEDESIGSVVSLTVYIAAEAGFTAHSRLADYASAYLVSELGTNGIGCRAAVGVATLPGDAPVEVQLIAAV